MASFKDTVDKLRKEWEEINEHNYSPYIPLLAGRLHNIEQYIIQKEQGRTIKEVLKDDLES